eukprot:10494802-Karenia_brevis.AAC.1
MAKHEHGDQDGSKDSAVTDAAGVADTPDAAPNATNGKDEDEASEKLEKDGRKSDLSDMMIPGLPDTAQAQVLQKLVGTIQEVLWKVLDPNAFALARAVRTSLGHGET